jgi:pyrimidine operon attenuation protein/uracil phosphoribosyltransferase
MRMRLGESVKCFVNKNAIYDHVAIRHEILGKTSGYKMVFFVGISEQGQERYQINLSGSIPK